MQILITFAVDAEFAPWKKRYDFRLHTEADESTAVCDWYGAEIAGCSVVVVLTGMGWKRFGPKDKYFIEEVKRRRPDICISTGLAGGVDEALQLGDVVAAQTLATLSFAQVVVVDEDLLSLAKKCGATIVPRILTSEQIVVESEQKKSMRLRGSVVDMESFFILRTMFETNVRAIAVRAISDVAAKDLPLDFSKVADAKGRVKKKELLLELFRKPLQLPALIKFAQESRSAAEALADFLDRYIEAIAKDQEKLRSAAVGS